MIRSFPIHSFRSEHRRDLVEGLERESGSGEEVRVVSLLEGASHHVRSLQGQLIVIGMRKRGELSCHNKAPSSAIIRQYDNNFYYYNNNNYCNYYD